ANQDRIRAVGAPASAPPPRPHPLAALRGGLGVRLRAAFQLAGGLHRLPPPQDRGGRRAAPDPDRARGRGLAAREVTLRRRLALLSALAVALTVLLASALVYALVRDRLRGDIDTDLRHQAETVSRRLTTGPQLIAGVEQKIGKGGSAARRYSGPGEDAGPPQLPPPRRGTGQQAN